VNSRSLNRRILLILLLFLCSAFLPHREAGANGNPQPKGKKLPKIAFTDTVSGETMKYLGLSREGNFSLDDMKGSLFVLEVFSTYCTSCPRNVPILNEVYRAVEKDAVMNGKIKIIGIAIGNTRREADTYKETYNLLFPVLTDYNFAAHQILGNPRVPYTMYVKKTKKGKFVIDTHQGTIDSAEVVLKRLRSLY
jgi:peroxiredoxin